MKAERTSDGLSAEKRALLAKRARANAELVDALAGEPIAIVGASCRFPGADSLESFWALLRDGVDAVRTVPPDRWDGKALFDPDPRVPGKMAVRWGGFLDDIRSFDAEFFGISAREAERMDPQQRLALEVGWEALESAGCARDHVSGTAAGVFIGVCTHDYGDLQRGDPGSLNAYVASGTAHSIVANRLSYWLNLRGPSLAVDTACSSSLVAVHLACESLRRGECELALAGGVNVIASPAPMVALSKAQMLAPDGRCKTFDARADGYARGEGCGIVALKRMGDAVAARDRILAIIRGSAVNQDGRTTGLTAPNAAAQQDVIREALRRAGVPARRIGYVEAHGTGTSLGDPIEIEGLTAVLEPASMDSGLCYLGSVKANIGHLEAAAGIAGLLKAVLAVAHRQIPPQVHFTRINPNIALGGTRFVIPTRVVDWTSEGRLVAGISSFGFGGTNAHAIVEEAPAVAAAADDEPATAACELVVISGHTDAARRAMAEAYRDHLAARGVALSAVSRTAALHRTHHSHRLAVLGKSIDEIVCRLDGFLDGAEDPEVIAPTAGAIPFGRTAFVFSGHGAEVAQLDSRVLMREPVFRESVERCAAALDPDLGWSSVDVLQGRDTARAPGDTAVFQPMTFAMQVALAALWRSWGIEPDVVVGHSLGEIAAAHVSGVLSLADAVRVVCRRSALMQPLRGRGRMLAVQMHPTEAEALAAEYPGRLALAASNASAAVVFSGDADALEELASRCTGRFVRYLPIDYPFHGPAMRAIGPSLAASCMSIVPQLAQVRFVSSVTERVCAGAELDAEYWGRNATERVRFAGALDAVLALGAGVLIEIGWQPVLRHALKDAFDRHNRNGVVLASLRNDLSADHALRRTLATLYTLGHAVNWTALYPGRQPAAVLPRYAWQRRPYWLPDTAPQTRSESIGVRGAKHRWLGRRLRSPRHDDVVFAAEWDSQTPLVREHHVRGRAVVPVAVMLDMVVSAARIGLQCSSSVRLDDVVIASPLGAEDAEVRSVQLILEGENAEHTRARLFSSRADDAAADWVEHLHGRVSRAGPVPVAAIDIEAMRARCAPVEPDQLFDWLEHRGLKHGPSFRRLLKVYLGQREALVEVAEPVDRDARVEESLPPELFEGCLLAVAAAAMNAGVQNDLYIPLSLDRCTWFQTPSKGLWSHAVLRPTPDRGAASVPEILTADLTIVEDTGARIAMLEALKVKRVPAAHDAIRHSNLYSCAWVPMALQVSAPSGDADDRVCVIFGGASALGRALVKRVSDRAREVLRVVANGDVRLDSSGAAVHLNPYDTAEFEHLLRDVLPGRRWCDLIFLWAVEPAGGVDPVRAAFHLTQALARVNRRDVRLWIVTEGVSGVEASPAPASAEPATLWGLGASFALEHPDAWGGLIDLDTEDDADATAAALGDEMAAATGERVALRRHQRYVSRLQSLAPMGGRRSVTIRADATWLVTGGLGSIGSHLVRWLAGRKARHVVVLTRRAADAAAVSLLQAQLPPQTELVVVPSDVGIRADVESALETIRRRLPPLAGIFHLAGVLDNAFLAKQTWPQFEHVMGPKARGAWHLHELTLDQPLDWFVMFSSIAGVLGSIGQANYAAANAYLDGLARVRRARGLPALSVAWGLWAGSGMAGSLSDTERARLTDIGLRPLDPEGGLAMMEELMALDAAHGVVLPIDWASFDRSALGARDIPLLRAARRPRAGADARGERSRLEALPVSARGPALDALINAEIARCLGMPGAHRVDDQRGFFDLGLDSLMAVELHQRLEQLLEQPLSTTIAFDHPNVREPAEYLHGLLWPPEAPDAAPEPLAVLGAAVVDIGRLTDDELDRVLVAGAPKPLALEQSGSRRTASDETR